MSAEKQTLGFQTEVKQLLHLVVHSLYSNKEIFLRELVSNASDALDKLRFLALSDSSMYENDSDLKIVIDFNESLKTITISDNGIGMNKQEVMDNLGTIAKSGTKEFLSHLTGDQAKDSHLIGQFGVGFYSAFIVAKKVCVNTKRVGDDKAVMWESNGEGEYTITESPKSTRGTEITLYLRDEESEFLSDWRLRSIITKYSDHISWPIEMKKTLEASEEDSQEEDKEKVPAVEYETVNKAKALWTLQKSQISDEEYQALYKHVSHDFEDPLAWAHNHVEGKQQYISLLYIPKKAPFDLYNYEVKHGLKLYVKRVFIMDDAEQFLPKYLRFVKGVIDSSDLPLNVSRELLQDNKLIASIKSACVKRVLGMLEKMSSNNPEQYQQFWDEFGLVLKEGPVEDFSNREQVAKLLRFSSTHNDDDAQNVSLQDYVKRMGTEQDKIYYITASSFNAAKNSPHLEIFRQKGIEVLLLHDRIDEWLVSHLNEFDGKKLQSVTKGKLDLSQDEAQEEVKAEQEEYASVLKQIKELLEDKIKDVRITHRLTDSPACVVADDNDMGFEMQRILQSSGQQMPEMKPILEVNPKHRLIQKLHAETDDDNFKELSLLLFEQAVLAEGGQLDNPALFVKRVNKLLATEA